MRPLPKRRRAWERSSSPRTPELARQTIRDHAAIVRAIAAHFDANGLVETACAASLERLGVDTIDLYYQHQDDPAVPLEDSLGAFERLREQGKIRAVGISNFAADRVDEAVEKFEGELRDAAIRNDLGVFPFYSLANGFLTGKYRNRDDLAKSPRGARNIAYLDGTGMRVLQALDDVAAETGAALGTVALAWLIDQPAVTAAIASATSVDQLKDLTAALHLTLTLDQIALLDVASAEAALV